MSDDLTRDEIKAACEPIPGWEWVEEGSQAFARDELDTEYFLVTETPDGEVLIDYHDCDGIAILEATGCQYTIERFLRPEPSWGIYMEDSGMGHASGEGFDLPTAAVRAVNQWAENRKETP